MTVLEAEWLTGAGTLLTPISKLVLVVMKYLVVTVSILTGKNSPFLNSSPTVSCWLFLWQILRPQLESVPPTAQT